MAQQNEQADIEIPDKEDLEGLDESTDWKAKTEEIQKKHIEAGIRNRERNRMLRQRIAELEKSSQTQPGTQEEKTPDKELLKRLDGLALKVAGISADDEVELFNKWKDSTGRQSDDIIGNKIFQAELQDLRQAKANATATDVKGDATISGEKGTPEYWIAKATKDSNGELLFPDDLPNDYKLRSAIFDKLASKAKGQDRRFYNQK